MVARTTTLGMGSRLRRIGALAGLAPAALYVAWIGLQRWGGTVQEFWLSFAVLGGVAIAAGWTLAPFAWGPARRDLVSIVAFPLVGHLLYLPIGVVGSISAGLSSGGLTDAAALGASALSYLVYGLVSVVYTIPYLLPFGLAWTVVFRLFRGRWTQTPPDGSIPRQPRLRIRPRRIGLVAAGTIVAYGIFVAGLGLQSRGPGPSPPWEIVRPIGLAGLFSIPAVIATLGVLRGSRPLLIAAGVICLLQSFVAFSGVTFGFLVPAVVLLALGTSGPEAAGTVPPGRTAYLAGLAVIVLTISAWFAMLGLTETRCWVATEAADGTLTYGIIPETATMTLAPGQVAGGCDGGSLTVQGIGVGSVLGIGAIAFAVAGTSVRREATTQ